MLGLKDFLEVVNYRITEGDLFGWNCFGNNAYCLTSWNGDHDGWSFNIIFDTSDQTVYMVESCDYKNKRAYRFINPQWRDNYLDYGKTRSGEHLNQAWDDINYVDTDSSESWIKIAGEITGNTSPKLVDVEIELEDSTILELALMAHRSNITLNELINNVLRQEMASLLDSRDKQD